MQRPGYFATEHPGRCLAGIMQQTTLLWPHNASRTAPSQLKQSRNMRGASAVLQSKGMRNLRRFRAASPSLHASPPSRKAVIAMWCSKVLVAYDGSTPSAKALDLAQSIGAQDERIELVFVHVLKLFALGTGAEGPLIEEANRVHAALQQLAERVPNKAHAHLLKGTSPADLLLKCAEDEGCDLIVMGSRGKGGVKGYLGSVSYAVVQGSPVAVLIAKDAPGAEAAVTSMPAATHATGTGESAASPNTAGTAGTDPRRENPAGVPNDKAAR